jgi:hypothetical protein
MALRRVLTRTASSSGRVQTPAVVYKTAGRSLQSRLFSGGHEDADFVALHPSGKPHITSTPAAAATDDLDVLDDFDEDTEDMVDIGPMGAEYGGPTRGGKLKEPTRFGDWERKGRCSDF